MFLYFFLCCFSDNSFIYYSNLKSDYGLEIGYFFYCCVCYSYFW